MWVVCGTSPIILACDVECWAPWGGMLLPSTCVIWGTLPPPWPSLCPGEDSEVGMRWARWAALGGSLGGMLGITRLLRSDRMFVGGSA